MKRKENFQYATFCFIVLILMTPDVYSKQKMEVLNYINISTTPRHEWYPSVENNPVDNEFLILWRTSGKMEESDTESFHSIDGRRVSPEGELLDGPIQLSPPELDFKTLPKAAHNIFSNEYMVVYTIGPGGDAEQQIYVVRIDNDGKKKFEPYPLNEVIHNTSHPAIVFNSVRQEYLAAYNDGYTWDLDNLGFIVDEDGNKINQDPITIGSTSGIQFNPQLAYNPTDDRYLVNWEDFRNQITWTDPTDIYGSLLDSYGNSVTVEDIAMCDDHDEDYGIQGDQRVQVIAHNSDKNEYLVAWMDRIIIMDNPNWPPQYPPYFTLPADIVGRIIGADGTPKGEDFIIVGAEGNQSMPQIVYVKERKKYFAVWQDSRNDTGGNPYMVDYDIYGKWLKPSGAAAGPDIPICTAEGSQTNPVLDYNPSMDRILIVWRDNNALGDYEPIGWCYGHICETIGDIKGAVYGVSK